MELSKRERKKLRTLKKGIRSELAFCPILLDKFASKGFIFTFEGLVFLTQYGEKVVFDW